MFPRLAVHPIARRYNSRRYSWENAEQRFNKKGDVGLNKLLGVKLVGATAEKKVVVMEVRLQLGGPSMFSDANN